MHQARYASLTGHGMLKVLGTTGVLEGTRESLRPMGSLLLLFVGGLPSKRRSRAECATFLWPDKTPELAGTSLRELLCSIRKWEQRNRVRLLTVERAFLSRDQTCVPTDLESFLALEPGPVVPFPGELMEAYHPDTITLQIWLQAERRRVEEHYGRLALAASNLHAGPGVAAMLAEARRLLPFDDRLTQAEVIHYALSGQPRLASRAAAALRFKQGDQPQVRRDEVAWPDLPKVLIRPPTAPYGDVPASLLGMSAGFMQDVTLALGRERTFAVFAPHTARLARPEEVPAGYIVTSQLRGQDRPALGVSMVEVATGKVLVAHDVPFSVASLMPAYREICQSIAAGIGHAIARAELGRYRSESAPSAYVEYLRGQSVLDMHSLKSIRRAAGRFRRALKLVPDFVPASALLARARTYEWLQFLDVTDRTLLKEAHGHAARAVDLAPFDERGHRELGLIALYEDDLDAALHHYAEAEQLAPHNADLLADQADVMSHASKWDSAEQTIGRALRLNPLAPDGYLWTLGAIYFFTHRYAEAVESLERMGNRSLALALTAAAAAMAGDQNKARAYARRTRAVNPTFDPHTVAKVAPQRDPADTELYVFALRKAGL